MRHMVTTLVKEMGMTVAGKWYISPHTASLFHLSCIYVYVTVHVKIKHKLAKIFLS